MFEFEAYEVLKTKEFTVVNDCFQNEYNEKIGHYGQKLFSARYLLFIASLPFSIHSGAGESFK